ncbi:MAG TPA: DUF4350 domain-containing protein [Flavisolibacter sp.]|nr:DUF4350 domain-containing protein [Flavisolibacter sp.]
MRKYTFHIIAGLVAVAFLLILIFSVKNKKMDERITLKQADKIPYGTAAAKELLPSIFPHASIYYNKLYPAYWDSLDMEQGNQAVIMVADLFNADEDEISRLISFVKKGNYVFIVAKSFSYEAAQAFHISYNENTIDQLLNHEEDSLKVQLEKPVFSSDRFFVYPGKKYESSIYALDTMKARVLGRGANGRPDFIQMQAGEGNIFIHVAPLAFSNYFILHKDNHVYYQAALSVIPASVDKVLWNEYYLVKPKGEKEKEPNWLGVLMKYPAFKWALLTGMLTLLVYVLLGMRRMQRMIPAWVRPQNDSLDFIKTMGRLYYDKRDHKNLVKKMASYFLDHVRSNYKLSTYTLDAAFARKLAHKTGYPEQEITLLVGFINDLDDLPALSDGQLTHFHKQLELFYQNT